MELSHGTRYYNRLLGKIIKASKGQRDALYFAARRMNMIKDILVVPTLITSAILGSALMTSHVGDYPWMKWTCASIAFLNALMLTIHKISRPGELGEIYQTYGRKWELFAMNVLSMRKWQTQLKDTDTDINHDASQLITRYNSMIEQSPLLPRWALSKFKASNEDLSSDEDDTDMYYISEGTDDLDAIALPLPPSFNVQRPQSNNNLTIGYNNKVKGIHHVIKPTKAVKTVNVNDAHQVHNHRNDTVISPGTRLSQTQGLRITCDNVIGDDVVNDPDDISIDITSSIKGNATEQMLPQGYDASQVQKVRNTPSAFIL